MSKPLPECTSPTGRHSGPDDPPMGECPRHGLGQRENMKAARGAAKKELSTHVLNQRTRQLLAARHTYDRWAYVEELTIGDRRLDGWAVKRVSPWEMRAYEIKVTRADALFELANPQKHHAAMTVSNRLYFVTPPGIIKPEEIAGTEWGLIECEAGYSRQIVQAPWRELPAVPRWALLAELARRAAL